MSLSTSDGHSVEIDSGASAEEKDEGKQKDVHLLPPVDFPGESFAESLAIVTGGRSGGSPSISRTASNASRRLSYMSELRRHRDKSDTASMLTVDEITAEVENRRMSTAVASLRSFDSNNDATGTISSEITDEPESIETFVEEEDEEEHLEGDDEDMLDDEDYDDEEDGDQTLAEVEDDAPVVGTGGKRGFKWIRGALIGAGSFGSVYLGMDAMTGLLMAVKQVELPSGSGPNEERKKSMLSALEREIDLLKELQHENIVQYLGSYRQRIEPVVLLIFSSPQTPSATITT